MNMVLLLLILSCLTNSDAVTVSPKAQETTTAISATGFLIVTGPWGDNETQNVQLNCQVDVTESKNPGEFSLLLSLDRNILDVTPYTLELSQNTSNRLQFTFTNTYIVPVSTFVFDFKLSYRVDQGETAIPGGNCSEGEAVTTTIKTSTYTASTLASSVTDTTSVTTSPPISVSRQPSPSGTSTDIVTTDSSSSSSSSSSSGKQSTSTVVTQAVSVAKTSTTASNTQTTVIEKEDSGNIFSRIRDGYVYSIVLVAGLALAFIILLALLAWCIYYFGCRRRGSNRVNDETNSNRKCRERNINRQNSTSNLLPRQGKMMSNKL